MASSLVVIKLSASGTIKNGNDMEKTVKYRKFPDGKIFWKFFS